MLIACTFASGCALGPRTIEQSRLQYNEAVKTTSEQQLLLNIVRLRYTDVPSSLALSSIADQRELAAGLKAIPFFTSAGTGPQYPVPFSHAGPPASPARGSSRTR